MHVARVRSMLWFISALAAAGAAAAWVLATRPLGTIPASASVSTATANSSHDTAPAALPPLAEFERAWQVPLRRPLADPPPAASAQTQPAPPRPPNLMVRLIGTIVAGDRPRGVFLVGLASVEVKSVGEKAGGAEILRIEENHATLSYDGETFTIQREKHPFDPNGGNLEPATAAGG